MNESALEALTRKVGHTFYTAQLFYCSACVCAPEKSLLVLEENLQTNVFVYFSQWQKQTNKTLERVKFSENGVCKFGEIQRVGYYITGKINEL